jgi:hypothetical protein
VHRLIDIYRSTRPLRLDASMLLGFLLNTPSSTAIQKFTETRPGKQSSTFDMVSKPALQDLTYDQKVELFHFGTCVCLSL